MWWIISEFPSHSGSQLWMPLCWSVRGWTRKASGEALQNARESTIYITLDTLKYLKKGGRITPAAAALGTILKIKPVLQIQGEKLDAYAKARTVKQAKTIMVDAIKNDIAQRFGGDASPENVWLAVAHTDNLEKCSDIPGRTLGGISWTQYLCGSLISERFLPYRTGSFGCDMYKKDEIIRGSRRREVRGLSPWSNIRFRGRRPLLAVLRHLGGK